MVLKLMSIVHSGCWRAILIGMIMLAVLRLVRSFLVELSKDLEIIIDFAANDKFASSSTIIGGFPVPKVINGF